MSTKFCTITDLERRVSVAGVELRIDDDFATADSTIEDATTEVLGYCGLLYDAVDLAASNWVKLKTVDIAVFYLCLRRLNMAPQSAQLRYEKAIADLERIQSGQVAIPDAPQSRAAVPAISNQRVRLRPFPQVVTEPGRSTQMPQTGYTPHNDRFDYQFYDI